MNNNDSRKFRIACDDPGFLFHVCTHLISLLPKDECSEFFDFQYEYQAALNLDFSGVQDSFRFKALYRARKISAFLVGEDAEIVSAKLEKMISWIENKGFPFYPNAENDIVITSHVLNILKTLKSNKIIDLFKRFKAPLCHAYAEKLILETLGIDRDTEISTAHIRRAVLCASLTPLRQNVGSCFATAPAILIQKQQYESFLSDLYQLLFIGKLKRTFGGVEYAVPLSPSTGVGDLKKNLLLSDRNLKPWRSLGLIAAIESLGVIDQYSSFEEKSKIVKNLIEKRAHDRSSLTVDVLLQEGLREKLGLLESQIATAYNLEKTRLKKEKMRFGVSDFSAENNLDKIEEFKKQYAKAEAAFNGICENALLKAWEFTLASFSEVKMEFSTWNLYSSLGMFPQEPEGIGQVIHHFIQQRVEEENRVIEKYQKEYELAFDQARSVEVLFKNAGSASEARRLQAEYQSRAYHMRICEEMRDTAYLKGSRIAELYPFLMKEYEKKFPEYFQEIYDAKMQEYRGDQYDDSPAGFRLVYKHGRIDPSSWTFIYNQDQYIDSLIDFFESIEGQLAAEIDWEPGKDEILNITSAIILHLRTEPFLTSAIKRMSKAHRDTLEKKPWAYVSGGTMTTLLKTYYFRQTEFSQEERWVESEMELLIFLIDVMKHLSASVTNEFIKDTARGMLMASPSHAFILLPGEEKFRQGWQAELFTYSWVRDQIFMPSSEFYLRIELSAEEQSFLIDLFCEELPLVLAHELRKISFSGKKSIIDFRNHLVDGFSHSSKKESIQNIKDTLDAFLYEHLPVTPSVDWKIQVKRLLADLFDEKVEAILNQVAEPGSSYLSAKQLQKIAQGCYLLAKHSLNHTIDLHSFIVNNARKIGLFSPSPIVVADTNWTCYFFGFVVNPGTGKLELWRLDHKASKGFPMSNWKHWLDGSEKKPWTVYMRPMEYRS